MLLKGIEAYIAKSVAFYLNYKTEYFQESSSYHLSFWTSPDSTKGINIHMAILVFSFLQIRSWSNAIFLSFLGFIRIFILCGNKCLWDDDASRLHNYVASTQGRKRKTATGEGPQVSLGPFHMEASLPDYRDGPVGEAVFALFSYGEFPVRLLQQKLETCRK